MAKAQSVYQYEAPRCPDNWNEVERRFYSRVIEIFDDIYIKYGKVDKATVNAIEKTLSGSSAENFEGSTLTASVAHVVKLVCEKAVIDVLSTGKLAAYSFEATFGHLVSLSAKLAEFDFETVQSLVASALVVDSAVGTNVRIKNLIVDYAQMTLSTIDNLCIKAADGNYYLLNVNPETGEVTATPQDVTKLEEEAGVTSSGNLILETEIVAGNLTANNLYAATVLANEITAYRIDVDALTARAAFIQSLTSQEAFIKWLTTEQILGEKSLTMVAGEVAEASQQADYATAYDSEEPPAAAPAAGKLWIDRGTTPPIFRRWKGKNVSTDRDWSNAFAIGSGASPNAYYDNTTGLLESIDSVLTAFTPGQEGSGTPGPGNIRALSGYTYTTLWQNSYGQTDSVEQKSRVDFGETIYGAEIDWLNGMWKQTHWEYVLTGDESISVMTHNGAARFIIRIPDDKYRPAASRVPYCTHFYGTEAPYGANDVDYAVCVDANLIYLTASGLLGEVANARNYLKNQAAAGNPVRVVIKLKELIVHTFTPAVVDVFESFLFLHVSPDTVVAPRTLAVAGTFSGWETLNSTEDIRAAQTQIQVQQQNAQAAIDDLRTAVVIDNDGVHVRKVDNDDVQLIQNEVLITQKDVNIVSGGVRNSSFGSGYVRLLDMIIRVGGGGLVIEAAEG